jgi:glycosyltransferase involved in cell wall biosynthesis
LQDLETISLIIPAYQEEKRIEKTLSTYCGYLAKNLPGSELIVVCDGCTDRTADVARSFANQPSLTVKVIEKKTNEGKGAAIRTGFEAATGKYLFYTDADLSYDPSLFPQFLEKLDAGADIVIAQRAKKTQYPGLGRQVLAKVSRFLVGNFITPGIRDSQAGFKGFTANAAHILFRRQRTKRFLFDLELIVIARQHNLTIEKITVDWQDQPGSTVRIVQDTIRSVRDLFLILLWKTLGMYG